MRNIHWYIDKAIERNNFKSKRQFCNAIGVSSGATQGYKVGYLPTDETMIKISKLAGIDPYIALMDLNAWRSKDTPAENLYKQLGQIVSHLCIIASLVLMPSAPAKAASICSIKPEIVYIM